MNPMTQEKQSTDVELSREEIDRWFEVFGNLVEYSTRETCLHENTYRGGSIWTICDSCGRKWADDEGGPPEGIHDFPKEITEAHDLLHKLRERFSDKN